MVGIGDFMFSLLSDVGPEIPFSLLLMALLGLRAKVVPKASLWIAASADKVWELIELKDGKEENWGRTRTKAECVDAFRQIYRKTYQTELSNGLSRAFEAFFSVSSQVPQQELVIAREGLQGKSSNNELLLQTYRLTPEHGGTRLDMSYEWGPRPLIAQLTARADLWGGAFRLKGLAETGLPNERPYQVISALVAVVTGLMTLAGFALLFQRWDFALLVIFALLIHELGHLLAYRLMGQPWGRIIFLPFLGAIAMPRLPFESQGQTVFAALMGPGISTILSALCVIWGYASTPSHPYAALLGIVTVGLNIFNLLPVEPLDGGIALRSVLTRLIGPYARFGLIAIGVAIAAAGFFLGQIILVIFGGIAILANIKDRTIDAGLKPLTSLQVTISFFGYVTMVTAYVTMFRTFAFMLPPFQG
jgi:Zn-dependent protease